MYTSRYIYFFVHILDQLNDRASLDLLLRRVKKRLNDYVNYTKLWEDICTTYIKVCTDNILLVLGSGLTVL